MRPIKVTGAPYKFDGELLDNIALAIVIDIIPKFRVAETTPQHTLRLSGRREVCRALRVVFKRAAARKDAMGYLELNVLIMLISVAGPWPSTASA